MPRQDRIVVLGFLHVDLAQPVQPLGEHAREVLGHVLHDHDARAIDRHLDEELADRLRPAGGGSHGDEAIGGLHSLGHGRFTTGGHGRLDRDLALVRRGAFSRALFAARTFSAIMSP
jgi:hypothetical protein